MIYSQMMSPTSLCICVGIYVTVSNIQVHTYGGGRKRVLEMQTLNYGHFISDIVICISTHSIWIFFFNISSTSLLYMLKLPSQTCRI